jgi:uncharacterized repeat protein (TIGR03803 family)
MTNQAPHRNWSWQRCLGVATGSLALVIALGRVVIMTPSAEAHADATFTVLYSFKFGVTDGQSPYAGLVRDAAGNLYGTTLYGGSSSNCSGGCGTVFKLDTTGKETLLHSFEGPPADGANPFASLVRDAAGNLYGTTLRGGASDFGTVFKLDTTGTETVLHSFVGSPTDGQYPRGGLVRDSAGNLYGTTSNGGSSSNCSGGCGTVFKLDTTGTEIVLHSFVGLPTDGANPFAGLLRDAAGNLYGTTAYGGSKHAHFCAFGCGTVFKLDTTGKETVLHSFMGAATDDGALPEADLVQDAAGNLYGTTFTGGDSPCYEGYGCGTVFELDATGKEIVLHSFAWKDGASPDAVLIRDAAGNLYGTTSTGGAFGWGTVFKLSR